MASQIISRLVNTAMSEKVKWGAIYIKAKKCTHYQKAVTLMKYTILHSEQADVTCHIV